MLTGSERMHSQSFGRQFCIKHDTYHSPLAQPTLYYFADLSRHRPPSREVKISRNRNKGKRKLFHGWLYSGSTADRSQLLLLLVVLARTKNAYTYR